jgi:hypothetical protein
MIRWLQPSRILPFLGAAALAAGLAAAANAPAQAAVSSPRAAERAAASAGPKVSDQPPGFLYGTDSWPIAVKGSAPYPEPVLGSPYGGYIGMTGNWAQWQRCGDHSAWSPTNSADANTNFTGFHVGIGTGVYWFMGGPGVDPHYNGKTSEARAWGVAQAQRALSDIAQIHVTYPVVFADVEIPGDAPGISPAQDNGWNSVYTSACSGQVKISFVATSLDHADFKGFTNYISQHSKFTPGVYSAPAIWSSIFGTGSDSVVNSSTDEWTYIGDTSSLSPRPTAWCLRRSNNCAQFFGGVNSNDSNAVMWQWSGGGGTSNGFGDFDQIDLGRTPSLRTSH